MIGSICRIDMIVSHRRSSASSNNGVKTTKLYIKHQILNINENNANIKANNSPCCRETSCYVANRRLTTNYTN